MSASNGAPANIDLSVDIGGVTLTNPTIAASGCYNRGAEFGRVVDISAYGAITLKSVTREPRLGNAMPRIALTPAGMLNAIGLEGPGIDYFVAHEAPKLSSVPTVVIASAAGFTVGEFVDVASAIDGLPGVAAIELDVSCPNVDSEGECFAVDPRTTDAVVAAVKRRVKLPVIAKLTPNVADIRPIARAAEEAGADAISLVNSLRAMAIDVERARPTLANGTGGLTGPAIRPVAVYQVWESAQTVRIPIIGMGGIETGRDALELMMAGASAVAIGTANFRDPLVAAHVRDAIAEEARRRGFASVRALTGLANPGFAGKRWPADRRPQRLGVSR
ncbi:MAG: dihydroorotate dehydrogenase [Candidatus Eremiobacteraeota bacterium]|nr:dihydroorotate dehydrogenase [Candidatus Eremiobacteraeota bacterium]